MTNKSKAQTQRAQILFFLTRGRKLTPLTALHLFGSMRLAAHIHELRRRGFPIKSRRIEVKTKYGKSSTVSEYWIEKTKNQ